MSDLQKIMSGINFAGAYRIVADVLRSMRDRYLANKKTADVSLCLGCFLLILTGVVDLAHISRLFFGGLMYITVKSVAKFYVGITRAPDKAIRTPGSLREEIQTLPRSELENALTNFVDLCINWLVYCSLLLGDVGFHYTNLVFGGWLFGGVGVLLKLARFAFYMQYCRQFVRTLEFYSRSTSLSERTRISEDVARNTGLPAPVRQLINVMSVNNVICDNLLERLPARVLDLVHTCWTTGSEMASLVVRDRLSLGARMRGLVPGASQWLGIAMATAPTMASASASATDPAPLGDGAGAGRKLD